MTLHISIRRDGNGFQYSVTDEGGKPVFGGWLRGRRVHQVRGEIQSRITRQWPKATFLDDSTARV